MPQYHWSVGFLNYPNQADVILATLTTYMVGSRICDPIKMVVFYDADKQKAVEMMVVCLILLRNKQGAFASVDDFGRVILDTTTWFLVKHPMFCPIV
jgi:hypothetical protein